MAKKYETPDMFSKLHHQQHYQSQSSPHHPFHLSKESQTSEDDDSAGPTPLPPRKPALLAITPVGDGASIEVSRKPRGRPPGSKNKPKPPLVITQDSQPAMSPYILEVPGGSDVVEALTKFSIRKNTGLCVLTGTGTVTNVTLRQPSAVAPGTTVTFHGRFDILSISATILPHASPAVQNGFSISLAGPQGQIVGGFVAGRLVAAGTVFVIAASFDNPSYHRLPLEEEVRNDNSVVSGGGGEVQSPAVSGGGGGEESAHAVTLYSCQLPSDVIWAPTAARPPPPPPPY